MAFKTSSAITIGPLDDRVVIRSAPEVARSRGGLFIPDSVREKPQEGEVMAVGPGRFDKGTRVPVEVRVGDAVLYARYTATEVIIDGEALLIVRESDVLAVLP